MCVKFLKEIEVRISRDFVVEFCRVDVYKVWIIWSYVFQEYLYLFKLSDAKRIKSLLSY